MNKYKYINANSFRSVILFLLLTFSVFGPKLSSKIVLDPHWIILFAQNGTFIWIWPLVCVYTNRKKKIDFHIESTNLLLLHPYQEQSQYIFPYYTYGYIARTTFHNDFAVGRGRGEGMVGMNCAWFLVKYFAMSINCTSPHFKIRFGSLELSLAFQFLNAKWSEWIMFEKSGFTRGTAIILRNISVLMMLRERRNVDSKNIFRIII